ncbi:hypothetical protein BW37_00170 [Janthinobacterium lividum]|jgi:hypothetical protein|nr:hypothetical protein BW37_00170 [Janthinobacterium lividum]
MNLFAAVAITSHLYRGQQQAKASVESVAIFHRLTRFSSENFRFRHEFLWLFFFAADVDRLGSSNVSMNLLAYFAMKYHLGIAFY